MSKWRDVPFSTNFYLEKVALNELPLHLGQSASLDKQIGKILNGQTEQLEAYWLLNDDLIGVKGTWKLHLNADEAEIEIEGKSSGYFLPATREDPPEDDEERELTKARAILYQDGQIMGEFDLTDDAEIYNIIEPLMYEVDIGYILKHTRLE